MNLENKIKQLQGQFDFKEPNIGHFNRFEKRLNESWQPRKQNKYKKWMAIVAMLLLLITVGVKGISYSKSKMITPEFQQTETYFSAVIKEELKKVNAQKNTENQQIINDAFRQMNVLENDYQKLQEDLKQSQNKKAIIYAMLNNYQQRIYILQNLLATLEKYNHLKKNHYDIQNI